MFHSAICVGYQEGRNMCLRMSQTTDQGKTSHYRRFIFGWAMCNLWVGQVCAVPWCVPCHGVCPAMVCAVPFCAVIVFPLDSRLFIYLSRRVGVLVSLAWPLKPPAWGLER